MSNRIYELINLIRDKALSLHEQLLTERSNNEKLQSEVDQLKELIAAKEDEIVGLKSKIDELEVSKTTNVHNITGSEAKVVSDEQIDELVREIDYCIEQLKK